MSLRPPALPTRILARALAGEPAGPAILGDLHADFVERARRIGARRARLWYCGEALLLSASIATVRSLRLFRPSFKSGPNPMPNDPSGARGLFQDLRYAFRAVQRDARFFAFAALVVGLGVGASTAVFSVMSPLMLAPLPFPEAGQLVWIENDGEGSSLSAVTSRTSNLRDFREQGRSFDGLTGYNAFFNQASYSLVADGRAEQLVGADVAHDFLDVLGVSPLYGRSFTTEEGAWDGPQAVILTHGLWVRRFGADPDVVGTSVTLNGVPRSIVGVLPETFDFSSIFTPSVHVDFLRTFAVSAETDRWGNTTSMVGRLRPDVSVEAAQSELDAILSGLREADPGRWGLGARVSPLQQHIAGPFRGAMMLLAAAAGAVMLIVCVNLSNMLLARSPRRKREMAVRRTLGATRARLVRQLIFESLIMSMSGAAVGLGIAWAVTHFVAGTSGVSIPMLRSVSIDIPALLFTLAAALAAGVAVGTVPALQVSEGGESEAMKAVGRGSSTGLGAARLREFLIISEVALACVLVILGGLFMRSFQQVLNVDLGYTPENAVAWQLNPSEPFESNEAQIQHFGQIIATVLEIPGVESAGLIDALPLGKNRTWGMRVVGEEYEDDEGESLFPHIIDIGYMEAMKIPLLAGRHLSVDDTRDTDPVVLINAAGAARVFGDGDPVGRLISTAGDNPWRIVGVVGDVKHLTLELGSGTQIYFPMGQVGDFQTLDLVVRASLDEAPLVRAVSAALTALDPGMPTDKAWALTATVHQAVSSRRFTLQLLAAFAATALLLAGLGIYGVLSYSVAERAHEIGIRMALGASGAEVRRSVVGRTMALSGLGISIGLGLSILGSRLIGALLFGVRPTDPVTLIGMIALLLVVAGLAGLIPAVRASRTDLLSVLRG